VIVKPDGQVKVLDFGLAKMVETEGVPSSLTMSPTISMQATMQGTILGTAPYMSPEQARGRTVDRRSDVWAFGCVLFEMLMGKRAFDGADITDTIAAIVRGEPDWSGVDAVAPPHVVVVLRGCLAKDLKERFADIAVPLYLLTQPQPASTGTASATTIVHPLWRRALPFAAAVVITAAIVAAGAWSLRPAPRPAPAPVARFPIALPQDQIFSSTGRRVLAVSPDGGTIAYVANSRLYLRSLADAEAHAIPGTENPPIGVSNPVFSPDGRQLAFLAFTNGEAVLKRISVSGGVATTVCPVMNPRSLRWEEDGLVFAQEGQGILRVSPTGGVPEVLVAAAEDMLSSPQLLPHGRGVLFSIKKASDSWDQGRIVVQTPDGKRHTVMTDAADGHYVSTGHLLYAKAGVLVAVPFNLDRLATSGDPIPVVEGVRRVDIGANLSLARINTGIAQFAVADTGTLAYVPGPVKAGAEESDRLLAIFDGEDGMERLPLPTSRYRYPRAARTGGMVAFEDGGETDSNIYVYSLTSGTAARRLTFGGHNLAPIWSPDGQWIAFQSDREGDMAIFRQRSDGSGIAERLTKPEPDTRHAPLAWSPDGQYLLFTADKRGAFALFTLTLSAKTVTPFNDVRSSQPIDATYSPDGRWVLYSVFDASDSAPAQGPRRQAFVQPFPITGAKYLVPIPGASHPMWSASDNRLIFNTGPDQSTAVTIRTTPNVTFTPPAPFSRKGRLETNPSAFRRNVDVLPDGRFIGVAQNEGATGTSVTDRTIMVVVNWFTELNRRVPPGANP
jgi:Tol biopolymer transport system component